MLIFGRPRAAEPCLRSSRAPLRDVSIGLVRTMLPSAKGIRLVSVTLSSFERPNTSSSDQLELRLGML